MDLENINNDNVFDKLKEFLDNSLSENFHILEDEIDIHIQTEYFDASKSIKENIDENAVLLEIDLLFKDDVTTEIASNAEIWA